MRNILLIGAAALAFGAIGSSPVLADRGYNSGPDLPCLSSLTSPQTQCAVNFVAKPYKRHSSNDDNTQFIKQSQGGKIGDDIKGPIQLQLGANIVLKGDDNNQTIKQRQWIEVKDDAGCTERRGRNNNRGGHDQDCGAIQSQLGLNVVVKGDDNTQSIYQSQSYDNNHRYEDVTGNQQAQGALNIVMGGDGNTQTIVQSQSLEVGGGGHHGGPY